MAENLNYALSDSLRGCYENDSSNCETYGRLYTWTEAMNLDGKYSINDTNEFIQPKHQGICPEGWHIPDNAEWSTLESYVDALDDMDDNEGYWLKAQEGWDDKDAESEKGIDGVGFTALPSGNASTSGGFGGLGKLTGFWSASQSCCRGDAASNPSLLSTFSSLVFNDNYKSSRQSVRCLKD